MLSEAEKYKTDDNRQRERIGARNKLETYVFAVKQALNEAGSSVGESERSKIRRKCDETLSWLERNSLADKGEYEDRLREITRECAPLMKKRRGGSAGSNSKSSEGDGPVIEEVD
ncbi:unnamed protein product [Arctia plantaginis]|uniref:Heat shock protein 70 n=1 Tax=Arctia plantaginis TaxID=874455 RepID=A0A8S1BB21_ARCPL|nr:unnamed protein product [Arctia plantaginis]